MLVAQETSLGPAVVTAVEGNRVRIDRPHGETWARLALAQPYRPEPGDEVLAIGGDDVYVIGVLQGSGTATLDVPGNLRLRAAGTVEIEGGRGVSLQAPEIALKADRLETVVRTVVERLVRGYRWVKGLLQTHAGRTRTIVEGHSTLRAERIVETADKDVKIDGERILLG